jgi:hypothetical protein
MSSVQRNMLYRDEARRRGEERRTRERAEVRVIVYIQLRSRRSGTNDSELQPACAHGESGADGQSCVIESLWRRRCLGARKCARAYRFDLKTELPKVGR